jgi:hypothetical protein
MRFAFVIEKGGWQLLGLVDGEAQDGQKSATLVR